MALRGKRNNTKAGVKHGEVWGMVLIGLAVLFLVSFIFYVDKNNPLLNTEAGSASGNYTGKVGALLAYAFLFTFGLSAYIIPVFAGIYGTMLIVRKPPRRIWFKILCLAVLVVSGACILSIQSGLPLEKWFSHLAKEKGIGYGGVVGTELGDYILIKNLGAVGSSVILIVSFMSSLLLITEAEVYPFVAGICRGFRSVVVFLGGKIRNGIISLRERQAEKKAKASKVLGNKKKGPAKKVEKKAAEPKGKPLGRKRLIEPKPVDETPVVRKIVVPETFKARQKPTAKAKTAKAPAMKMEYGEYKLPSTELLDPPVKVNEEGMYEDMNRNSEILEQTLRNFGIEAKVGEIRRGPVITRYEIHPAPGIKVKDITSRSDDIALAMKTTGIRILAPIPGKGAVGIEIPNRDANIVRLREVLESKELHESKVRIPIVVGKSIEGKVIVADLTEMPHLLIAGATGTGKSVCINSAIMAMLFHLKPDEVKLIMVDPKKVELAMYNVLPHLLIPVISDKRKVANSLNWLTIEMEKRYDYLSQVGTRNIQAFNARPINRKAKSQTDEQEENEIPDRLPYIVVIIDELADLMSVAAKDVENAITRLAQLSRAVGIHLIIATQRPSVNVITGVIKANLPARISFQVASKVDSRTVLDANGADKLIGNGDALFLPPGTSHLVRVQGTFVSDEEINRVLGFVKEQAEPQFDHSILQKQSNGADGKPGEKFEDELFDDAVDITITTEQASASNLQRRLRIGYARAARLIDMMEAEGVIGPARGSKPREILVSQEETFEN